MAIQRTTKTANPTGRKVYTDPSTGEKKQGAVVPLAKIRADTIWRNIKPYLDQYEITANRIVVAIFKTDQIRQIQKDDGSTVDFYLPEEFVKEDVWQGVSGLIVQQGPRAWQDSDKWKHGGMKMEVGDWVTFNPANTILQKFGSIHTGVEVRVIQDCYIISRVAGPHVMEDRTL